MTSRDPIDLEKLGWNRFFTAAFDALDDSSLVPARVGIEHNHLCRVYTRTGTLIAHTAGKLRHAATGPEALPAVGDWVGVRISSADRATIREVLPRQSCFSRKAAGDSTKQQVVAANVNSVLLVSGLDGDFNLRRVERYLVAAAESGAAPVIVLNKTDVTGPRRGCRPVRPIGRTRRAGPPDELCRRARPRPARGVSGPWPKRLRCWAHRVSENRRSSTTCSAGTSSARKSFARRIVAVGTRRCTGSCWCALRVGVIIDTPGMRELRLWDTDRALKGAFDAIEQLATGCHFRNCQHRTEPRCAVREAVADGRLSAGRLKHYQQLRAEQAALNQRRDELAEMAERRRTKTLHRAIRTPNPRPKQSRT